VTPVGLEHDRRLGPVDRVRLAGEVLGAYRRARRLLRSRTAPEAVAELRAHARRHPVGERAGLDQYVGARLAHAVTLTLRPLPTDVRCLSQSLTLLNVMERRDLHPTLVIGVRPEPFSAHAWIELDGRPLLPPADPDHERLTEL
jgi:hypothetical protein